jgi:hypothetical protein
VASHGEARHGSRAEIDGRHVGDELVVAHTLQPLSAISCWEAIDKRPYPLQGVLVCGDCGSTMKMSYVNRPTKRVPYYRSSCGTG